MAIIKGTKLHRFDMQVYADDDRTYTAATYSQRVRDMEDRLNVWILDNGITHVFSVPRISAIYGWAE